MKLFRKAAEQGEAEGQRALGWCYDQGHGVPQNYAQALHWYLLAARQGVADAQYRVGYFYQQGMGVQRNLAEAVNWYRQAARQGYAAAQQALRDLGY